MHLHIMTVNQDLLTIENDMGVIELDDTIKQAAAALKLFLILTIDPHGITVFNRLHFDILDNEIQTLKQQTHIKSQGLEKFEKIIRHVSESFPSDICYIKLIGVHNK